jgi:predicted MFS family arabinose efflux permease
MPRYLIWLTIGAFAIGTEAYMIAGILPLMAEDLRVSVSITGQLVTVFAVGYAVGSPILTVVTAGMDRKRLILGTLALFGVANLLASVAPNYGWLMVSRVLLGVGAGTFFPAAGGLAAMAVPAAQRGRALALIYSGLTLATVFGVPLGTALGERLGWRATFIAVAVLSALALLGIAAGLPRVATPPVASLGDRLKLAARRDIQSVLALTVIALTGGFAVYTYFAPFLETIGGFQGDTLALVLLLFGVGAASGNFFGGYAADKWNIRRFLMTMLLLSTIVFAGLSLLGQHWLPIAVIRPLAVVAVFLWGFISWSMPSIQQFRLVSLSGPLAPIALSLNSSAIYLGIGLGAVLGSVVIASGSVASLGWAGAICAALAFLWVAAPIGFAAPKVQPAAGD